MIAAPLIAATVRPAPVDAALRLDRIANPYAPSPLVAVALESLPSRGALTTGDLEALRRRIGAWIGLPATWIAVGSGVYELVRAAVRIGSGSVALFPPTDAEQYRAAHECGAAVIEVPRVGDFAIEVGPEHCFISPRTTALASSPNDPTGTILPVPAAVRLARRCELLVVDEQHGAYSPRTLLPLVREFDNVIVLRTFETWAGLEQAPLAFAVAPPKLVARLEAAIDYPPASESIVAASASLDDIAYLRATLEQVRIEKSRLFRMLRKLNMLRPYPSWANFVLARMERGDADYFQRELLKCGIAVYRPRDPLVSGTLRISATNARATSALKRALVDAAANV